TWLSTSAYSWATCGSSTRPGSSSKDGTVMIRSFRRPRRCVAHARPRRACQGFYQQRVPFGERFPSLRWLDRLPGQGAGRTTLGHPGRTPTPILTLTPAPAGSVAVILRIASQADFPISRPTVAPPPRAGHNQVRAVDDVSDPCRVSTGARG